MPPFPFPVITLADHIAAGAKVTSYCSAGLHSRVLDLQALMNERGPDAVFDYNFKKSLTCQEWWSFGWWHSD